jgi:hypothetical protein
MKVQAVCESGHRQSFTIENMSPEWVEMWAGLMDGTSPLYVHPPDEKSVIGKCGICGKPFKASVVNDVSPTETPT